MGRTNIFNNEELNARGVAILFNRNLQPENVLISKNNDDRIIEIKFEMMERKFKIVNIYAPNQDNPNFFRDVLEKLVNNIEDYVIVMEDFNQSFTEKDKKGGTKFTKNGRGRVV